MITNLITIYIYIHSVSLYTAW